MSDVMDLRGLSCPQPVMRVREVLQESGRKIVRALVDSAVARDNIERSAVGLGWRADIVAQDGDYLIILTSE